MSGPTDFGIIFAPSPCAHPDRCFFGMGQYVKAHRLIRERHDPLLWLNARSDRELARIGLTRDGIPLRVLPDLFG